MPVNLVFHGETKQTRPLHSTTVSNTEELKGVKVKHNFIISEFPLQGGGGNVWGLVKQMCIHNYTDM